MRGTAIAALWLSALASCSGPDRPNVRQQTLGPPSDTSFVASYWDDGFSREIRLTYHPVTISGHDYLVSANWSSGIAHRGGCRACSRLRCPCDSSQVDANAAYLGKQRMGTTRVVGVYGAELNAAP